MRTLAKKVGVAAVATLAIAAGTLATTTSAEARYYGHHWHGGWGWGGPAFVSGLALGALATRPYYGYGYGPGYAAYGYGDCYLQRRVRYTPYGPVVRHVRVCY
jgi:hypothetical protein